MPRFSVVIPTRNRRALLTEALASVWAQRHQGAQVIVVDDGSTDGTREYLASISDRVTTVLLDGRGPGAARNAGARVATGDYLAFLDSDDSWLPWSLESFDELLREHGNPALLSASFRRFAAVAELSVEKDGAPSAEYYPDFLATWPQVISVAAGMMVVRRDEFLRVNGFTDRPVNFEDHDLLLRLGTAPGFVRMTQPLAMGWRLHLDNITADLTKAFPGGMMMLEKERAGRYPGGAARADARRGIITADARALSVDCARAGLLRQAIDLYTATALWHVQGYRIKYLATFPLFALLALFRVATHRAPQAQS